MSWDIWLVADLGSGEVRVGDLEQNYTHNTNNMIRLATGTSPYDWDGLKASELAAIATKVADAIEAEPVAYAKLNPPNKWGSAERLQKVMRDVAAKCNECPNAIVRASC